MCNCVGGRTSWGQKGELKGDRGEAWGKGGKPRRGRRWQDLDAASNKHRLPARKPIISLKAEQHLEFLRNWRRRREGKMVGQSEGAFGNDLTNVMTPDSQEELARRFFFLSFQKKCFYS